MRRLITIMAALLATLLLAGSALAQTERRVALVIGNAQYRNAPALRSPVADAQAMARMLQTLGFEVTTLLNGRYSELKRALKTFEGKASGPDVGVVYFSGYGVSLEAGKGKDPDNWLI